MEAQALLRSKMVRSVSSIMNVDTLSSLEQVGSALTAIAGDGSGVDNEGKARTNISLLLLLISRVGNYVPSRRTPFYGRLINNDT